MIRYANAAAFKQAVEVRLRTASSSGLDFERRRQLLVFDRFLARLTSELGESMILKGGLVVELRVERYRRQPSVGLPGACGNLMAVAVDENESSTSERAHHSG